MRWVRFGLLALVMALLPAFASAAPYAALVMDARTGEVLHSTNADTRLHPASLTKMMTLYVAFEAIEHGEISLDTLVTVSARAAKEQPSRLGLRAGQKIALRYLIRAAAIKSANDAATAIAEAIEGSVPAFGARMTRTAKALGMKNSTFKNANGLTESGHLSTARDMTVLGRHLFYDYPEYYNLFSRRSADAGLASVNNTNTRFLDSYKGADGIKTGFTNAAGFNLTASAERGSERIIATVFGGTSTPQRNAKMVELLDLGFAKAPTRVREQRPAKPAYSAPQRPAAVAQGSTGAKTIRVSGAVQTSPRPLPRQSASTNDSAPLAVAEAIAPGPAFVASEPAQPETLGLAAAPLPVPRPEALNAEPAAESAASAAAPTGPAFAQSEAPQPETLQLIAAPPFSESPPVATAALIASDDGEVADLAAQLATLAIEPAPEPAASLATVEIVAATPDPAAAISEFAMASSPRPLPAPRRTAPLATSSDGALTASDTPVAAAASAPAVALETAPAVASARPEPAPTLPAFTTTEAPQPETLQLAAMPATAPDAAPTAPFAHPAPRPEGLILTSLTPPAPAPQAMPEVITRLSTSGGQQWGVSLGKFSTSYQAERVLLQTALMEAETLGEALRKVANRKGGFDATFVGMPQQLAEMACRRLAARQLDCAVIGP
ncbi:MAG: serine hydrolase [Rhodobacteraceae bacterium]|nr:serine hydrolase [Paracoccaceae bacterium]